MLTFLVIALYVVVAVCDFVPTVRKKKKNEIWAYSIALFVSFIVLILYSFDIPVPSPSDLIRRVVETLFHVK